MMVYQTIITIPFHVDPLEISQDQIQNLELEGTN